MHPPTVVVISGYIDLPATSGNLGTGEIITYADNDPININHNGSQIDYISTGFNLNVRPELAMNPNENVFMTQRDVVRVGPSGLPDVGEFRLLMKLPQILTTTGTITLDFGKNDFNGRAGGFSSISSQKKVCEFIDIITEERIACQVVS